MLSAAADVGMSETELWETTPAFLHARLAAKREEIKRAETHLRWHLELARQGALWQINLQLEKKDRLGSYDFFPLPWDEKPVHKQPSDLKKEAAEFSKKMGYDKGIPVDQFF